MSDRFQKVLIRDIVLTGFVADIEPMRVVVRVLVVGRQPKNLFTMGGFYRRRTDRTIPFFMTVVVCICVVGMVGNRGFGVQKSVSI